MKKIATLTIMILLLLGMFSFNTSAQENVSVYIDGAKIEFDVQPQIINGRTMVPMRAIFEKLGAIVEWDRNTDSIVCTKDNTVVMMTVDSIDMYINNQITKMDTPPVVIEGRTLVPARYVAEAFGADVQWSQKNNSVVICSKDVYAYADYPDIPDLGRCYNIPIFSEHIEDGFKVFSYVYSDIHNDEYYSYLYDNSALILGKYTEKTINTDDNIVSISYTKSGDITPRYYIGASYIQNNYILFVVMIPIEDVQEYVNSNVPTEETFVPPGFTDGYELADFSRFNSYAYENGLSGTKIYLHCTLDKINCLDTDVGKAIVGFLTDNNGHKWFAILNTTLFASENEYNALIGKSLVFCGVYEGYSSVYNLPSITLTELCVKNTGEIKSGIGKISYMNI